MSRLSLMACAFAAALVLACSGGVSTVTNSPGQNGSALDVGATNPNDDLDLFVSRFGPPDETDSTEYDNPRPLMVTKFLIYRPEDVRAAYVAEGSMDHPPPYSKWRLIGFENIAATVVIDPAEVVNRLAHRERREPASKAPAPPSSARESPGPVAPPIPPATRRTSPRVTAPED